MEESSQQFGCSRRPWLCWSLLINILAFAMVAQGGEPESPSVPAGAPDDGSVLCISKCGTCPVICTQPPPLAPPSLSPPPMLPPPPADDSSVLCISKCDTCPLICSPPPPPPPSPPPPPQVIYITTNQPPPPSKPAHMPPPPPEEGQKGGLSYPYYYFYTSLATRSFLLPGILRWLPVLSISFSVLLLG